MLKKLLLALFVVTSLQGCFQRVDFQDIAGADFACKGKENVVFVTAYAFGGVSVHCSNAASDITLKQEYIMQRYLKAQAEFFDPRFQFHDKELAEKHAAQLATISVKQQAKPKHKKRCKKNAKKLARLNRQEHIMDHLSFLDAIVGLSGFAALVFIAYMVTGHVGTWIKENLTPTLTMLLAVTVLVGSYVYFSWDTVELVFHLAAIGER